VELAALREVRRLAEVLDGEQRGRALARRGRQDRRVEAEEAMLVEILPAGADHLGANAQHRVLTTRAQPQVAVLEQEPGAVLLGRDRELGRRCVQHAEVAAAELVADGRALVGADGARHLERALLRKMIGAREDLDGHVVLPHDALDGAAAVPELQEVNLPARASCGEPAAERDALALVRADVLDPDCRHRSAPATCPKTCPKTCHRPAHTRTKAAVPGTRAVTAADRACYEPRLGGHPCSASP